MTVVITGLSNDPRGTLLFLFKKNQTTLTNLVILYALDLPEVRKPEQLRKLRLMPGRNSTKKKGNIVEETEEGTHKVDKRTRGRSRKCCKKQPSSF